MNYQDLSACLRALRCIEGDDLRGAGVPMSAADDRSFLNDPVYFFLKASDERQKAMFRLIASRCRNVVLDEPPPPIPLMAEILDATDVRRERNRPLAEAGNAAREREDAKSLSLR